MEFQHRMLRAVVAGIVDKALRDLPRDPKRGLRNLVDLGDSCAKGPQQKRFFARAHAALQSPASPYYQLVADAVSWVDPRVLRTMGVNLGASGLTWGVGRLRQEEAARGGHLPWMLLLDGPARADSPVPREANALGCYIFVLRGADAREACALAGRYPESAFFAELPAAQITPETAALLEKAPNLAVSVEVAPETDASGAFGILHAARRLYGFAAACTPGTADALTGGAFLDRMRAGHCLYGCFRCPAGEPALEDRLYRMVCGDRGRHKGRPLLLIDLRRDAQYVAEAVSPGSRALRINPALPLGPQLSPRPENAI